MTTERPNPYAKAIARAWIDPDFKTLLKADPRAALLQEGVSLPPDVAIHVHEETPKSVHIVLPPALPSEELDDAALASTSGGNSQFREDETFGGIIPRGAP